jgi:hypothetical protein
MARPSKTTNREKRTYSWLLLLESRHARPPEKEPTGGTGERGRPRLNVATYPTSITLSKGDREAIDFWQGQLSTFLGRKVSIGETVGFLARVCQERITALGEAGHQPESLEDLVQSIVVGPGEG